MKFVLHSTVTTVSLSAHLVKSVNQVYFLHQFIRILLYMDSSIQNGTQRSRPMLCFILFWYPRSFLSMATFPNQCFAEHRSVLFEKKSWNKLIILKCPENANYPLKYRGNFCTIVGSYAVSSLGYELLRFIFLHRRSSGYEKLF
jgi:hypothetical protein